MSVAFNDDIDNVDPEISGALEAEITRQNGTLSLIASENHVSPAVLRAQGSVLTNKYAEGYPEKRYYAGCEQADEVERLAQERASKLWGANHVNVQPHSGSQANQAVYHAVLEPDDTILSLKLEHGGHLSHGAPVNFSGSLYDIEHYTVDVETGRLDYSRLHERAREVDPDLIISGFSAYPRTVDWTAIQDAAEDVDALHLADIAHITGLCATGHHPNPVGVADIVTGSTHKTIRAGRGGIIMTENEELAGDVDSAVFPGVQGGPSMHNIAGKAVGFKEALSNEFDEYIGQVVANAEVVAERLEDNGISLVSGGTDNHLVLADLRPSHSELSGGDAESVLADCGLILNANSVPNDTRSPFDPSGIRIGTPAVTTRGFDEEAVTTMTETIIRVLDNPTDESVLNEAKETTKRLATSHPVYPNRTL